MLFSHCGVGATEVKGKWGWKDEEDWDKKNSTVAKDEG